MSPDLVIAALRQGDVPPGEAWKLLAPLLKNADDRLALRLCDALRSWTWRALDRRRRDAGLREWADILNRAEAFLGKRSAVLAGKIEVLVELIHESISVSELSVPQVLLRRKHIASILRMLASRNDEWVERGTLMNELNLKAANTTRLMSLLVDAGWVEQVTTGREAVYRLSTEGMMHARKLGVQKASTVDLLASETWKSMGTNMFQQSLSQLRMKRIFVASCSNSWPSQAEKRQWEKIGSEIVGGIEYERQWDEDEEDSNSQLACTPKRGPVFAYEGAEW